MINLQKAVKESGAVAMHETFSWCSAGFDFWRLSASHKMNAHAFVESNHRRACTTNDILYLYGFVPKNESGERFTMQDAAPIGTPGRVVSGFVFVPEPEDQTSLPVSAFYDLAGGNIDFGVHVPVVHRFFDELQMCCRVYPYGVFMGQIVYSIAEVKDRKMLRNLVVASYHKLRAQMEPMAIPVIDDLISQVQDSLRVSLEWAPLLSLLGWGESLSTEYRGMVQAQYDYVASYPTNPTVENIRKWMNNQPICKWHHKMAMRSVGG